MKRITRTILLLFILIYSSVPALALTIPSGGAAPTYLFSVDGEGIWTSNGCQLFYSESMEAEPVIILTTDLQIIALTSYQGDAYVAIKDSEFTSIRRVSKTGKNDELFDISDSDPIVKMLAFDQSIAFLHGSDDRDDNWVLKFFSYQGVSESPPFQDVYSVFKIDDGRIGIQQFNGNALELRYVDTNNFGSSLVCSLPQVMPLAYCDQDLLIGIMNSKLMTLNPNTMYMTSTVGSSVVYVLSANMEICGDVLAVLNPDEAELTFHPLKEFKTDYESLVLVNVPTIDNEKLDKAADLFHEKNPLVKVTRKNFTEEQLIVEFQSNTDEIDIIYVDTASVHRYVNAGILLDMSENERIMSKLDDWVDLYGSLTVSDIVYGIPMAFHATFMSFDEELLREFKIPAPEAATGWKELMEWAKQVSVRGIPDNIYPLFDDVCYPAFVSQYTALFQDPNDIDFLDEEFVSLVEQYGGLVDDHLVYDYFSDDPYRGSFVKFQFDTMPIMREEDVSRALPLPMLAGKNINPSYAMTMGINTYSSKVEYAVDFLDCYSSIEVQSMVWSEEIGFLRNLSYYPHFNDFEMEEKEHVYTLRRLFEASAPEFMNTPLRIYARSCFEEFYTGKINARQLAFNLQEKLDMILNE